MARLMTAGFLLLITMETTATGNAQRGDPLSVVNAHAIRGYWEGGVRILLLQLPALDVYTKTGMQP